MTWLPTRSRQQGTHGQNDSGLANWQAASRSRLCRKATRGWRRSRRAFAGQGASCPPKAPSKKPAAKEVPQNLQLLDDPEQAASILTKYTPLGDLERELTGLDLLGKLAASSATPRDSSTIELWFRSRDNPLQLLLLDDPFQNMDELTLLTIVRGLGRLLQLWRQSVPSLDSWRVVLLLHSVEGVERCRREVPCATYYLPWLSPLGVVPGHDGQDGGVIQPEPSRLSHELNSLTSLRTVE